MQTTTGNDFYSQFENKTALKKRNFISGKTSNNETPNLNYTASSGLKQQNYGFGSKIQEQTIFKVENNKLGGRSIHADFDKMRI